jgi:hypothetical protein
MRNSETEKNPNEKIRERERKRRKHRRDARKQARKWDKTLIMAEGFRVFRETLKPKPFCFVFLVLWTYCACFASAKYVEASNIAHNLLLSSSVNKDIDRLCEGRRRRKGSNLIPCSCLLLI